MDSHSSSSQDLSQDQSPVLDVSRMAGTLAQPSASTRPSAAPRSLLAAGKAPPGFGGAPLATSAGPAPSSTSCPTHQDPSIPGPPLGRFQPIQPPLQQSAQRQPPQTSYYSLWSGLPGLEFNLSQAFGVQLLGAYSCNPPGAYHVGSAFTAKPPPPGFGPVPCAPASDYGSQRLYQMGFGTMSGGSQFAGMARPPGMAV